MTKLLENGIDAVRDLPADQQNLAGELLLSLAEQSKRRPRLTPGQIDDVRLAVAEADTNWVVVGLPYVIVYRLAGDEDGTIDILGSYTAPRIASGI